MTERLNRSLSDRVADAELIRRALAQAVREALLVHKRAGNPVAVGQDGRVLWIQPADIPVSEDAQQSDSAPR